MSIIAFLIMGLGVLDALTTQAQGLSPSVEWGSFVEPNFPFFTSTLDTGKTGRKGPSDNLTPRGLILNLGHNCWACFDTDLLRISAVWIGAGVTPVSMSQISYHSPGTKTVEGEEHLPQIIGTPWLTTGIYAGWQIGTEISLSDPREAGPDPKEIGRGPLPVALGRFNAIRLTERGMRLEYQVGNVQVIESVEAILQQDQPFIQRSFHLERRDTDLTLVVGEKAVSTQGDLNLELSTQPNSRSSLVEKVPRQDGIVVVHVKPSEQALDFQLAIGFGKVKTWEKTDQTPASPLQKPRWPQKLKTQAILSSTVDAYVSDNIPLPVQNPWHRNIRLADIAFFHDGRAAAVTFDGDVWMIEGLSGELQNVQWHRFASGLQEPMGLCVRDDELFVCDRNGIWRLQDTDKNGEADIYEMFSNAYTQTAETREYAQGIRAAPDGSFVIAKGGIQMSALGKHNGTVLRISPDGRSSSVLGYGFRSPFIGINPKSGLITASDQQGNYVPSTPIHVVRDHQFYGFLSTLQPKEKYPAPIADPLTWIPYPINASGAGQVWLTDARMGPLNDSLIHIAYYRPEVFSVLLNERASRLQGAVVSVTRDLEFSPLNGAVNPADGQLYVTGFQIFGTTAKQISGLARIRYTGAPSTLPREVIATDKGFLIRFDVAIDQDYALDPKNFSSERWNYLRSSAYGSPHFKPDGTKGQEQLRPSSSYLSRDGKSIFIGIANMKPVMQMRLGWALATRAGKKFQQNVYLTPSELTTFDPTAEGFEPLTVNLAPQTNDIPTIAPITIDEGRRTADLMGCAVCHSTDGTIVGKVGPTWLQLFDSKQGLSDGRVIVANEAYLRESILDPAAKFVKGFEKSETSMPSYNGVLTEAQIESLILYIKSLK